MTLYWKTLYFGFVWDDFDNILRFDPNYNNIIDTFKNLQVYDLPANYYRPLALISWMVDRLIWGEEPLGYHLAEIGLHAVNVVLVFFLSKKLLSKHDSAWMGAAVTAVIFAVHPVQTEAVCWIAARPELLFTMFTLGSFFAFTRFRDTQKERWVALSLLLWFLAMLSKETAVAMVPCLMFYDILFITEKPAGAAKKLLPYIWYMIVFLIYFILRERYLQNGHIALVEGAGAGELLKRTLSAYSFYIQQVILPVSQKALVFGLPQDLSFILGGAIIIACAFYIGVLALKRGERLPLYFICFFLITLFPSILVAVTSVSTVSVAKRYLYLPLYAVSFLIGLGVITVPSGRYINVVKWIVLFTALFFLGYMTTKQMLPWQNDLIFWQTASKLNPDQGLPYQHIGAIYQQEGKYEQAVEFYSKAVLHQLDRGSKAVTFNNIGGIYLSFKQYEIAEDLFRKALQENKDLPITYYNLGLLYSKRADDPKEKREEMLKKSVNFLKESIRLSPSYKKAQNHLEKVTRLLENNKPEK